MRARDAENAGHNLATLDFLCQALEPQDRLCLDPSLPLLNQGSPLEKPQRVERAESGVTHLLLGQYPGGCLFDFSKWSHYPYFQHSSGKSI